MTKTKEELDKLKQDYESLVSRLSDLSDDELKKITGGNCDLLNKEEADLEITHVEFTGRVANREDDSSDPKDLL